MTQDDLLVANNREAAARIDELVQAMWRLKVRLNLAILDDGLTRVIQEGPIDVEAGKFLTGLTLNGPLYGNLQKEIDQGLAVLAKLTGREWSERNLSSHPE